MTPSIAVVNCSGNVGKTMVTRELLAPRLPDLSVMQVESINADEAAVAVGGRDKSGPETMIAAQFDVLHEALMLGQALIVDIGASNVEEYLKRLDESAGAHEDYGFFVVPVVPARKQLHDTFKTIELLADLGVEPDRIRVVFNQVEALRNESDEAAIARAFGPLIDIYRVNRSFRLDMAAAIPKSDAFPIAAELGTTLHAINQDDTDYKLGLAQLTDRAEAVRRTRLISLKRKSQSIAPKLDSAFAAISSGSFA